MDEKTGQSSFKCTLGIKTKQDDAHYTLGVLLDDELHYNNNDLMEQYFQRPSILQSFGWRVLPVFAKDWLEDSDHVLHMIIKHMEENSDQIQFQNAVNTNSLYSEKEKENWLHTFLKSPDEEKFWAITQNGTQLQIRCGKMGTYGQSQIKTFASEADALSAKEQLIEEQLQNGYAKTAPFKSLIVNIMTMVNIFNIPVSAL